jgi:hypothetical protein
MMTPEQKSSLDQLSRLLLDAMEAFFPREAWEATFTDRLEVVISAADPRFGDIHVWLDGDEVTVGIGEYFHTHFETYLDDSVSKSEADRKAATEAIEFIRQVVSDMYVLEIHYKGNHRTRAQIVPLGETGRYSVTVSIGEKSGGIWKRLFPTKERIDRYVWSGRMIEN